jgi:hypothetical protein
MIRSIVDYGAHEQESKRRAGMREPRRGLKTRAGIPCLFIVIIIIRKEDRASFSYDSTSGLKARGSKSVTRLRWAMLQARSIIITTVNKK